LEKEVGVRVEVYDIVKSLTLTPSQPPKKGKKSQNSADLVKFIGRDQKEEKKVLNSLKYALVQ
jgi:hypothetical protein